MSKTRVARLDKLNALPWPVSNGVISATYAVLLGAVLYSESLLFGRSVPILVVISVVATLVVWYVAWIAYLVPQATEVHPNQYPEIPEVLDGARLPMSLIILPVWFLAFCSLAGCVAAYVLIRDVLPAVWKRWTGDGQVPAVF